jgi:hypothetical protein
MSNTATKYYDPNRLLFKNKNERIIYVLKGYM